MSESIKPIVIALTGLNAIDNPGPGLAVIRALRDAFKNKRQGSRISFETPELLFRLLTAKRWEFDPRSGWCRTGDDPRNGPPSEPRCKGSTW